MDLNKFKRLNKSLNFFIKISVGLVVLSNTFFVTRDGWKRHISDEEAITDMLTDISFMIVMVIVFRMILMIFDLFSQPGSISIKDSEENNEN